MYISANLSRPGLSMVRFCLSFAFFHFVNSSTKTGAGAGGGMTGSRSGGGSGGGGGGGGAKGVET